MEKSTHSQFQMTVTFSPSGIEDINEYLQMIQNSINQYLWMYSDNQGIINIQEAVQHIRKAFFLHEPSDYPR